MFRFTNRMVLFFTLMLLLLGALYIAGNEQGYLDASIHLVSIFAVGFAISLAFFDVFGVFFMVKKVVQRKKPILLLYLLYYLVTFIISALFLAFFSVLLAL